MRISKLSLTNFRSFKETQTIEFAPVTLLFGPNSVGKSTVLMALFYLQQILGKGQCDPQYIEALGNKFVGGFKNLVNGKDLSKTITLRIEYTKPDDIGSTYSRVRDFMTSDKNLNLTLEALNLNLEDTTAEAETVSIELDISWSFTLKDAYVSRYTVYLDDEHVATATSDDGLKQPFIWQLNYFHTYLMPYDYQALSHSEMIEKGVPLLDVFLNNETENIDFTSGHELTLGFKGFSGALPILDKPLKTSFNFYDEQVEQVVHEILSNAIVAPLDNLLHLLNDSLCIGPLRHIPDSNYQINPYPQQADWYNGEACWDVLAKPEILRDVKINDWLASPEKLGLGYQVVYKVLESEARYIQPSLDFKTVEDALAMNDAVGNQLNFSVSNKNGDEHTTNIDSVEIDEIRKENDVASKLYKELHVNKRTTLGLWDMHNSIEVTASDVGVGVSQILPLVVAGITSKSGLVACEQPELHVHPRIQVAIGDLLTQANDTVNFLIETHSEHLILRIRKRIRQTTDCELPEGIKPVLPSGVSIVYLEASESGVKAKRINIDEDGEFKEQWPQGFFGERRGELM
jgi:hypothetical protein